MKKQTFATGAYIAPRISELNVTLEKGFQISNPAGADDWEDGNKDFMN